MHDRGLKNNMKVVGVFAQLIFGHYTDLFNRMLT